ncbi:MAG: spiro-SPASM protein, partial [Treponema sp.]|nr:spiro-SPASM protein [Treponema sp.]
FLDPVLAGKLAERHLRYAAEYSYADGWPYGLAPELLSPGTAAILAKILGDDGGPVGRDALFSVIQKDINAFDIETEISSVDLRCHRISLCADSRRNLLLLRRFTGFNGAEAEIPDTAAVERIMAEKPECLRTLPTFYPIQVFGGCPQACSYCPWPTTSDSQVTERRDFMKTGQFETLLEKIVAFSGDGVIDLSLWGELSLHPQKLELVEMVLRRSELALVIETSGVGWKKEELEQIAGFVRNAPPRHMAFPSALSWIVSLDAADPARYKEIRGAGFAEANDCAKKLLSLFPKDTYVQAVRMEGAEDDIERFYRSWKESASANVIIQKYDDFCGMLPRKQASDLSPVQRQPCWHLMRDMPILIDGTVSLCKQQICRQRQSEAITLGNAFTDALETIWERGQRHYDVQASVAVAKAGAKYDPLCEKCDEYYTYNF